MYPENNSQNTPQNTPGTCGDNCGTLPECAPLAVPCVPFQQKNSKRYSQQEALANGTLFPGLNLPFHIKAEAVKVLGTQLAELQALEFVLVEVGLYLDTHQDDAEAFALYRQYAGLEAEARKRYEAQHGPLTQSATAGSENWSAWLEGDWPWQFTEEGGGK